MPVKGASVCVEDLLSQGYRRLGKGLLRGKEVYVKSAENIVYSHDGEHTLNQAVNTLYAFVKDGVVTEAAHRNVDCDLVKHTSNTLFARGLNRIHKMDNPQEYLKLLNEGRMIPESMSRVSQTPTETVVRSSKHNRRLLKDRWVEQRLDISDGDIQNYEREIQNDSNLFYNIINKRNAGQKLNMFERMISNLFKEYSKINRTIYYGTNSNRIVGFKYKRLLSGKYLHIKDIDRNIQHNEAPLPRFSSLKQAFRECRNDL